MKQDTPPDDRLARTIAEHVNAAYARQASGTPHPQTEQTMLARLVEAIRPEVPGGSPAAIVAAVNVALDAWEQTMPDMRGPRIASVDLIDGRVGLIAAGPGATP